MKIYVKASKRFRGIEGNPIELERETRSLTYKYCYDGDYYDGSYHTYVKFIDEDGNDCLIKRILDVTNQTNPYGLTEGNQYKVSGYYVPHKSSLIGDTTINYEIYQPRISGIKGNDGKEMVLKFVYPSNAAESAQRLCDVLDQNNIEYKCYDKEGTSGYPIQFNVLRSGKKWNDIMRLINSVRSARYKQEKLYVERENGQLFFRDF